MDTDESLGKYLKREREAKNVSLIEVAKGTKVREHFLRALEDDQYHLLPSPTYAKGFLLSYARFLGLDVAKVLERYEGPGKKTPVAPPETVHEVKVPRKAAHLWVIGGIVAVSLTLAYLFYPSRWRTEPVPPEPEAEKAGLTAPAPSVAGVTSAAPVIGATEALEVKPFSLLLRAVERTWISVKVDDLPEQEMTLNPGEEVIRQGRGRIHLIVGNAGGLDLVHNGTRMDRFGKPGDVVILTCTPEGVTELRRRESTKAQPH